MGSDEALPRLKVVSRKYFHCLGLGLGLRDYARFPLPELTARVNGPSWRVTGFHYPSKRAVLTGRTPVSIRRSSWRVVETGHPLTLAVNSDSGNMALLYWSWSRSWPSVSRSCLGLALTVLFLFLETKAVQATCWKVQATYQLTRNPATCLLWSTKPCCGWVGWQTVSNAVCCTCCNVRMLTRPHSPRQWLKWKISVGGTVHSSLDSSLLL